MPSNYVLRSLLNGIVPSNYVLRSLLNGILLSLSLELFIEASFARVISSSSELSLPTSCKTQSSLVSESLFVAESVKARR